MKGEQEEGEKVEEKRSRRGKAGATTKPTTTFGMAEKTTIASAGDNRACSDGRSRENECGGGKGSRGRGGTEYGDSF